MKSKSKSKYRISNWSEYDASLRHRGSLTFWLNDEVIKQWVNQQKTGRRGASNTYSDAAIEFMVTIQSLFGLAGRQTLMFCGIYISIDGLRFTSTTLHSTVSRRLPKLNVQMPVIPTNEAIPEGSRLYRSKSVRGG